MVDGWVLVGCFITGLAIPSFVYAGADCQLPHAAWQVLEKYPGLGVYTMSPIPPPVGRGSGGDLLPECRVLALHGRPMNSAAASDQAAGDWMAACKDAFGVANVDLPFTRKISFGTPGPNMQPATVASMSHECNNPNEGPWVRVCDAYCEPGLKDMFCLDPRSVPPSTACETTNDGSEANFVFGSSTAPIITVCADPSFREQAMVSAFYHVTNVHNLFAQFLVAGPLEFYQPHRTFVNQGAAGGLGTCFSSYNISGFTGAEKLSLSMAGGGFDSYYQLDCSNGAYATPIAHEFGHFILDVVGQHSLNGGRTFGEGFADVWAMLAYDTAKIADGYCEDLPGTMVRDYTFSQDCERHQYPCPVPFDTEGCLAVLPSEFACSTECLGTLICHYCGKLLAGVWWDIRLNLDSISGMSSEDSLQHARRLFAQWTSVTEETIGREPGTFNTAYSLTAIQILSRDVDFENGGDEIIYNDTPNDEAICDAFEKHSIPCDASYLSAMAVGSGYVNIESIGVFGDPNDLIAFEIHGRPHDARVSCVSKFINAQGVLQSGPFYQPRSQWSLIRAKGAEILPNAPYEIAMLRLDEEHPIAFAGARTKPFGDTTGDYSVNIDDVLCSLAAFAGNFTATCTQYSADVHPCVPNGILSLDDLLRVLAAFGGAPDGCPSPCP